MAMRDRVAETLSGKFTEWTGLSLVEARDYERLREDVDQWETFGADASDLAFWVLSDPTGGHGASDKDLRRETRNRIAQASRRAWSRDPIAGTEAEHYANFSLGRGVNRPVCNDEAVQLIVDRGWKDSYNQETLLSLDALRGISNELKASSNFFLVAFRGKGRVRVGILPSDTVTNVVTYPGNPQRPLYYVANVNELRWDFDKGTWEQSDLQDRTELSYFAHWRNVEEDADDPALASYKPEASKLKDGGVYHVRTNRLAEQMFGVPAWNRTLRFMTSLNRLVEARVAMAQASASIIAKRVVRGGKSDVMKAAQTVLQQAGEIGAARPPSTAGPAGARPPIKPGSFHTENEGDNLQAFNLNSGSAQAMQDIQIVRGQAVSTSALGQHYYGDQDAAGATSAATLELPAAMAVGAWQEMIEQILRWFTDLLIEEAVRSGELGGNVPDENDDDQTLSESVRMIPRETRAKPLSELRITEAFEQEEMERRTGKDLGYTFEMPYPGRRNLPDIVSTFQTVMTQLSPSGENEILTETMLNFLFTHGLQLENASDLAKEINAAQQKLIQQQIEQQQAAAQAQADAMAAAGGFENNANPSEASGGPGTSDSSPDSRNRNRPDTARPTYGEPRAAAGVAQESVVDMLPDGVQDEVRKILAGISATYADALGDPAAEAAERLNGHGSRAA